MSAKLSSMF